jgi:hypothetical protein
MTGNIHDLIDVDPVIQQIGYMSVPQCMTKVTRKVTRVFNGFQGIGKRYSPYLFESRMTTKSYQSLYNKGFQTFE